MTDTNKRNVLITLLHWPDDDYQKLMNVLDDINPNWSARYSSEEM